VPFIKNNHRKIEISVEKKEEGDNDGKYMTEKQRKIAELRK